MIKRRLQNRNKFTVNLDFVSNISHSFHFKSDLRRKKFMNTTELIGTLSYIKKEAKATTMDRFIKELAKKEVFEPKKEIDVQW